MFKAQSQPGIKVPMHEVGAPRGMQTASIASASLCMGTLLSGYHWLL